MREVKEKYTRTWPQRACYAFLRVLARLVALSLYRIRVFGRENWPKEGGALICANHQGFFDPILVGLCCDRQMNFLAKESLFRFPLKSLIVAMNAIPVNRAGTGLDGLRETLRRLRGGDFVLIFPEGTRTDDGQINELKPGFVAVARKGRAPLIPVVFDGSYQAWPKWQLLPAMGVVHVKIGEPILPEEMAQLSDDELLARLQDQMQQMFEEVRYTRDRSLNPRIHTADKTQFA